MKQLTDTLWMIEVPDDAIEFEITTSTLISGSDKYLRYPDKTGATLIHLPKGEWQLIGTVTKDSIDFDCEPYVEIKYDLRYADRNDMEGYRDYGELHPDGKPYWFERKEDSFRSLIESKTGKTFINPLGEEPNHLYYKFPNQYNELVFKSESHKKEYADKYEAWQQAEANLIHKSVILKQITNE